MSCDTGEAPKDKWHRASWDPGDIGRVHLRQVQGARGGLWLLGDHSLNPRGRQGLWVRGLVIRAQVGYRGRLSLTTFTWTGSLPRLLTQDRALSVGRGDIHAAHPQTGSPVVETLGRPLGPLLGLSTLSPARKPASSPVGYRGWGYGLNKD